MFFASEFGEKEIDNVLYGHPKVLEAACIGVPDDIMGEEGKAFIALKPGEKATEEEIIVFCAHKLAKYKVPRYVEFVGSLPKSAIGKVLNARMNRFGFAAERSGAANPKSRSIRLFGNLSASHIAPCLRMKFCRGG